MKQINITVYTVDELSDAARNAAYNKWIDSYQWDDWDFRKCLESFERLTGFEARRWSLGDCYNYNFILNYTAHDWDRVEELSGQRLHAWLNNNILEPSKVMKYYYLSDFRKVRKSRIRVSGYDFSGMDADYFVLQPILDWMKCTKKDVTLRDIMLECFNNLFRYYSNDYEYYTSMEYFREYCEMNGLEFMQDGRMLS